MSDSTLCYFVDTNLFLQCHPLEQLDWASWESVDEVRLIVAKPVLREIDYRKNKGNDRASKRARATSAMFRSLLGTGKKLVRHSQPKVVLSIELDHRYSKGLEDELNYAERDDQLIGIVYRFAQRNQTTDVRLLTHDTVPILVAQGLNLKADVIPNEWLLPPETTKTEKRIKTLEDQIARLKQLEPSFAIRFLDQKERNAERYEAFYTWMNPLTNPEVNDLMECLKRHFPLESDFGSRKAEERTIAPGLTNLFMGATQAFVPATDDAITEYRDVMYPQWLESCEKILRHYHLFLQGGTPALTFTFVAVNHGTRPAADALLTVTAKGNFQVKPPSIDDDDDGVDTEDDDEKEGLLREPPVAPRGIWRSTSGVDFRKMEKLARSVANASHNLNAINNYRSLTGAARSTGRNDPNAFYYKPNRSAVPLDAFAVECEQWRHDDEEECFVGEIHFQREHNDIAGALVCHIQAGNLSTSKKMTIPVRIRTERVSAFKKAQQMVEGFLAKRAQDR